MSRSFKRRHSDVEGKGTINFFKKCLFKKKNIENNNILYNHFVYRFFNFNAFSGNLGLLIPLWRKKNLTEDSVDDFTTLYI